VLQHEEQRSLCHHVIAQLQHFYIVQAQLPCPSFTNESQILIFAVLFYCCCVCVSFSVLVVPLQFMILIVIEKNLVVITVLIKKSDVIVFKHGLHF